MSDHIQVIILGVVQGLTEFIPISSSGHLVAVRQILGLEDQGLMFDAVLHLATLLVVIIYFWRDWQAMFFALFAKNLTHRVKQSRRLIGLIMVTTVPAAGAGLLFKNFIDNDARSLLSVAGLMIFTGLMFILLERVAAVRKDILKLNFFDALSIGLAQAAAILPGISRSGATIITGMYHGLKREAAAKYSFLAAGPVIAMAGLYSLWQLFSNPQTVSWTNLGIGFAMALISGLIAVHFLLQFLRRHKLDIFAGYLIVIGLGLIVFSFI
ncbi:undecaprenyl-diphosphatase UppP [candidate division Kazan bacterium]|uniref:Undecaprenyl-diphosphatase n=1 Tax=candidate division Kazan bacterium TaxID=2202143 RepID=A0A420ZDB0_UNCK3|nr:MAG: undecaprenyl-diphosphatase UppP [candidate division Kazan bacterium]